MQKGNMKTRSLSMEREHRNEIGKHAQKGNMETLKIVLRSLSESFNVCVPGEPGNEASQRAQ